MSLSGISKKILLKPYYYEKDIPGAINDCYLREGAVERLLKAANSLPENYYFLVFDGWRPFRVQMALYENLKKELQEKGLTGEKLNNELAKYVDYPSVDKNRPSNHLTGGAIDLTIVTDEGFLNMGTGFDDFSKKSRTNYFEEIMYPNEEEKVIRENRRILKEVMENVGFTNFDEEWWHYDFGNQNWGMKTGNDAIYGGILELEFKRNFSGVC
ncbi:M15 family metallopeptidase [Bacillus sp. P1(2020)]|uniref:D-alanyl-D-alanine dipeptidase n=1 Tax=Pallidibacillus pasinlerensis TaxID=2703818 RepID=A0ABX0A820_9BACI|nr:M15 family metallopeptidase [Pallidibacillus pasinlerensis]